MSVITDLLQTQIAQIKEYLTKKPKPCLALVGRTGTGKTTALYHTAKELGYKVWSVDPLTEDLENVIGKMKFKPLLPTIIHITSADALPNSKINKLIEDAKKYNALLVFEFTEQFEHDDCMIVQFYKPKARDVAKLANGLKIPFDKIKMQDDLRQVILSQYGSMGYEGEKSITKDLEQSLRTGKFEEVNDTMLSLLLDSTHLNFYGKDLYLFIKSLQVTDKCKRGYPLSGFKVIKPTIISYFLEKLKLSRQRV